MQKAVLRCYTARSRRKNEQDLNRRSDEGWSLVRAGCLRDVFEQDSETVWRYGLDYCPELLGEEERQRREERYAEEGWDLVNVTAAGWAYYRKAAAEGLPEEAYRLPVPYTQAEWRLTETISLLFWLRMGLLAIGAVLAAAAVVRQKAMVLPAVAYLLLMLLLFFRMQALQEKLKRCSDR